MTDIKITQKEEDVYCVTVNGRVYRNKPGPKTGRGGPKRKFHTSIDPDLYLIAKATGNVSGFINASMRHFISSSGFSRYMRWLNGEPDPLYDGEEPQEQEP
jgi:hypothetical protein